MRTLAIFVVALTLASSSAHAAVCAAASGAQPSGPRWRVDHYVYDAALHKDWAVLIDCDHPEAPARMKLALDRPIRRATAIRTIAQREGRSLPPAALMGIKVGTAVEVSNLPGAPVSIRLSGTAMQAAFRGQHIRVRLSANGRFVNALVCGPHSVELAAAQPSWGQP